MMVLEKYKTRSFSVSPNMYNLAWAVWCVASSVIPQHEAFYVVACPCHVTVRGLQDYAPEQNRIINSSQEVDSVFKSVSFLCENTVHAVFGQKVWGYF